MGKWGARNRSLGIMRPYNHPAALATIRARFCPFDLQDTRLGSYKSDPETTYPSCACAVFLAAEPGRFSVMPGKNQLPAVCEQPISVNIRNGAAC